MCDRRLRDGLTDIISDTQSSFLRDKSIHNNNIRLVLDLMGFRHEMIESFWFRLLQGLLHGQTFIIITLEWFGFGEKCMNIIKLLYKFSFLAIQNIKVHWHKKRYSPGLVNLAFIMYYCDWVISNPFKRQSKHPTIKCQGKFIGGKSTCRWHHFKTFKEQSTDSISTKRDHFCFPKHLV